MVRAGWRICISCCIVLLLAADGRADLGKNWREAWDYPRRTFPKVVEHDGRLWISGGLIQSAEDDGDGGILLPLAHARSSRDVGFPAPVLFHARNDVWVSDNGSHWEPVTLNADFSPRFFHEMVSFDGMLWVIGGIDESGAALGDVWYSVDGAEWTEADIGSVWSPRGGHSVTVFDGGMWLIGGASSFFLDSEPVMSDEVWFSQTGFDWYDLTFSPHFAPRYGHGAAEYDGSLWLAGGLKEGAIAEDMDVWQSTDGYSWIRVPQGVVPVPPLLFPKLAEFQDRLWIVGGSPEFEPFSASSIDGANWTLGPPIGTPFFGHSMATLGDRLHLINLGSLLGSGDDAFSVSTRDGSTWVQSLPSRAFSSRNGFSLVLGGPNLLLIGGYDGHHRSDVWGTADGIHWTQIASNTALTNRLAHRSFVAPNSAGNLEVNVLAGVGPDGYRRDRWTTTNLSTWSSAESGSASSFVFNNARFGLIVDDRNPAAVQVLMIGGLAPGNAPTREVHRKTFSSSPSGWVPLNTSPPFAVRHGHGAVLFNERYWAVGGVNSSAFLNDVWSSADGVSWVPHALSGPVFSPRSDHVTLVHDGAMWVIGGVGSGGAVKDVWRSEDGDNWSQVSTTIPFPNGLYLEGIAWLDSMWVVVGVGAASPHSSVWRSSDGVTWQQMNPGGSYGARRGHAMASFDGGVAVTGGFDGENTRGDAWWSEDGRMWTPMAGNLPPRRYHSAEAANGRLYVIGGEGADGGLRNDVWSTPSRNGAWSQDTAAASFTPRRYHDSTVFADQLRVVGGLDPAYRNDSWRSSNGSSWMGGSMTGASARMGHRLFALDDRMYIVGGFDGNYLRDMLSSANGAFWGSFTFSSDAVRPPARFHHRGAVLGERMWLVGGFDEVAAGPQSDVWSSSGGNWTRVQTSDETPFANRQFHDVAAHDTRLWVAGGTFSADPHYGDVWLSNDPPRITRLEFVRMDYARGETLEVDLEFSEDVFGFDSSQTIAVAFPDTTTPLPLLILPIDGSRVWRIEIPYPDHVVPEGILMAILLAGSIRDEEGDRLVDGSSPFITFAYPPSDYMSVYGPGGILIPLE